MNSKGCFPAIVILLVLALVAGTADYRHELQMEELRQGTTSIGG